MRGVGGSLVYFLDPTSKLAKVWDVEFERTSAAEKSASAGLTVVDHISQSMHYEDMLSWLLFYTSLLDVRKTPQVDVMDPGGIVRSQVVEAADGTLRIASTPRKASARIVVFLKRIFRLGRSAHRVCNERYHGDGRAAAGERGGAAEHS